MRRLCRLLLIGIAVCWPRIARAADQPMSSMDPALQRPGRIDVTRLAEEHEHLIPFLHGRDGIAAEYVYTGEVFTNARGGLNTNGATEYRGNFDLVVTADLHVMGLAPGGLVFVYAQNGHGRGITETHVGDYQFLSNMDAHDFLQLSEYGWEKTFDGGAFRVKLGKQDCNVDFAALELGAEYIHSSFGLPPIIPMPTFPFPTHGAAVFCRPCDCLVVQAGVYEGVAICRLREIGGEDLVFSIFQAGVDWAWRPWPNRELPGGLHGGLWYHNGLFPDVAQGCPLHYCGSHGVYWGLEQWIYKTPDEDMDRGIGIFAQYAWAPEDRNEASQYVGAGVVVKGLARSRSEDALGAGVGHLIFSDLLPGQTRETAIEVFYRASLSSWALVQPDLQYIANPGGHGRDALVFGVRCELAL